MLILLKKVENYKKRENYGLKKNLIFFENMYKSGQSLVK